MAIATMMVLSNIKEALTAKTSTDPVNSHSRQGRSATPPIMKSLNLRLMVFSGMGNWI
jgi:hypothetical protein